MPKPILIKKRVVIDLEVETYSSFGLSDDELVKAVEKDLVHSIQERMYIMAGEVGCANDGKAFGYKFKSKGFKIK
jgi:hypothetical protein